MCNAGASNAGRSLCVQISRERRYPLDTTLKAIDCATTLPLTFFYIMKLCSRLRPLLPKLSKRRQIYVIFPHFEEVRGGVEPWLMARWNARVEFLLSVVELLFLSLMVEALQGKMCQNSLPSGGWVSLSQDFRGKVSSPCQYIDTTRKAIVNALQLCR